MMSIYNPIQTDNSVKDDVPQGQTLVLRVRSPGSQAPTEEKKSVDINPTFLLRGIDPSSILQTYLQGGYDDKPMPGVKAEAVENVITADHVVGGNPESEIYEYIDRTNTRRRIVTTNHQKYAIVRDGIQINGAISNGGICRWCRRKVTHDSLGTPIRMEYIPERDLSIFHVDGVNCTFECTLPYIKFKTHCSTILRETLYRDSETMLRIMFSIMYPGEKMGECSDWWLLESNGGPIKDKDFFSKSHVYRRTPNVILLPSKVEYTVDAVPH